MNKLTSKAALILLAVVALALIAANNFIFKGARVDLTEDKTYSIADGTVNIVKAVESDVVMKFFYSEKDSSELGFLRDYARRVTDLLEEYVLRSDGKLSLEIIDPEPFSEEEDEAAALGIQRVSLGFGEDPIFFGLVVVNEQGDQESIGFLHPDREEFLEYDVSRIIAKTGRTKAEKIGVIAGLPVMGGYDRAGQPQLAWQTFNQLRELYDVENLGTDIDDIPDDIDLLLLVHPDIISDQVLYAIDQYALRGGNILAFVDTFAQTDPLLSVAAQSPEVAAKVSGKFLPLLAHWGVELVADKVLADAAHALRVGGGATQRPTPHLGVYGYGPGNFVAKDHPVMSQLNNVNFSSSGVIKPLEGASTAFEPLVQSSDRAGLLDTSLLQNMMDPAMLANEFTPTGETYTVSAHITGSIKTHFADGRPPEEVVEAPEGENDKEGDAATEATDEPEKGPLMEHVADSGGAELNLFIVSDTDVLHDPLWVRLQDFFGQRVPRPFADNGNFFFNAVENILGSTDLMSLRSRGAYARPFHVVEDLERDAASRFQDKEQELQQRLAETESRLGALQQQKDGGDIVTLSAEQQQEVDNFRAQQLTIRKELREVQHELGQDIEKLGGWIKLLNIVLVPFLVVVGALILSRRRSRAVRNANRQITSQRATV